VLLCVRRYHKSSARHRLWVSCPMDSPTSRLMPGGCITSTDSAALSDKPRRPPVHSDAQRASARERIHSLRDLKAPSVRLSPASSHPLCTDTDADADADAECTGMECTACICSVLYTYRIPYCINKLPGLSTISISVAHQVPRLHEPANTWIRKLWYLRRYIHT
jgi:hypothetical protein